MSTTDETIGVVIAVGGALLSAEDTVDFDEAGGEAAATSANSSAGATARVTVSS
jgi:hypothetical protein